ncbi:MAG: hypothetical protein ABJN35_02530 [Erythrobacter sp.]
MIKRTQFAKLMIAGVMCASLSACALSPEEKAAAIEEGILSTPGAENLWATIKEEYPDDFDQLVGRALELDLNASNYDELSRQVGAVWSQEFFARIGLDSIKAPAEDLIRWSAAESELYQTLQRSAVEQCGAMTMGEWVLIDDGNALATAAIARRNEALVRASAAGRDNPQTYAEPTEADFNRLGDSIAATGIAPELQAALASDAAMAALSPQEQCEVGVAVYAGLSALPDEQEPEMAAYMLSPE